MVKTKKRYMQNIIIACVAIVTTTIAAEIILSFFAEALFMPPLRRKYMPFCGYDPLNSYKMRPRFLQGDLYLTDDKGRLVVYDTNGAQPVPATLSRPKRKDSFRIVVVGDSFTAGAGVRPFENYVSVAHSYLKKHTRGREIETVNLAVPGYNLDNYYYSLLPAARELKPDLIVIGFFAGNDFLVYSIDKNPLHIFMKRHSAVFRLLLNAGIIKNNRQSPAEIKAQNAMQLRIEDYFPDWKHQERLFNERFMRYYGENKTPSPPIDIVSNFHLILYIMDKRKDISSIIDNNTKIIQDIGALTKPPAPVVVLLIPFKQQISDRAWNAMMDIMQTDPDKYDRFRPQRFLERRLQIDGIGYIDTTPLLLKQPDKENLYFPVDAHWTAQGHRIAGTALGEYIRKRYFNSGN